jgi:hypothetical protein
MKGRFRRRAADAAARHCPYPAITLPQPKSPDWAENITYGIPGDEVTTRAAPAVSNTQALTGGFRKTFSARLFDVATPDRHDAPLPLFASSRIILSPEARQQAEPYPRGILAIPLHDRRVRRDTSHACVVLGTFGDVVFMPLLALRALGEEAILASGLQPHTSGAARRHRGRSRSRIDRAPAAASPISQRSCSPVAPCSSRKMRRQ